MSRVQFFKGTKEKLNTTSLNSGSIYFIPEEGHLYIDTAYERIPIVGSGVEGYLYCDSNKWFSESPEPGEKAQQTILYYYNQQKNVYPSVLPLQKESIIYTGNIYRENDGEIQQVNNLYVDISKDGDNHLIIKPYFINNGTKTYYTESTLEQQQYDEYADNLKKPLWIYFYCPNPQFGKMREVGPETVLTETVTLYGLNYEDTNNQWYRDSDVSEYRYDLYVDELDLEHYPFMIALSDDNLENYKEFFDNHILVDGLTYDGAGTTIHFITNTLNDVSYFPEYNIKLDIISFADSTKTNSQTFVLKQGNTLLLNNSNEVAINNNTLSLQNAIVETQSTLDISSGQYEWNGVAYVLQSDIIEDPEEGSEDFIIVGDYNETSYEVLQINSGYSPKILEHLKFETEGVFAGQLYTELNMENTKFKPIEPKSRTIKTNVKNWKWTAFSPESDSPRYFTTSIQVNSNTISIQDDNIKQVVSGHPIKDFDNWGDEKTYSFGKIYYEIDTDDSNNVLKLYYAEQKDPEIAPYKIVKFSIFEINSVKNDPSFLYYQNSLDPSSKIVYTLYSFIDTIRPEIGENEDDLKQVTKFKVYFKKILSYLLGYINVDKDIDDADSKQAMKQEMDKYILTNNEKQNTSLEPRYLNIVQLNNLANLYDITLTTKDWTKDKDKNLYYCVRPNASGLDEYFVLSGKKMPLVFPISKNELLNITEYNQDQENKERFNAIVETKIMSGKIYFYAEKLPEGNINICIADFK